MEPKIGTFHDVLTGEVVVRELTQQEIEDFGEVVDYVVAD
jgi:hypothetical protein